MAEPSTLAGVLAAHAFQSHLGCCYCKRWEGNRESHAFHQAEAVAAAAGATGWVDKIAEAICLAENDHRGPDHARVLAAQFLRYRRMAAAAVEVVTG